MITCCHSLSLVVPLVVIRYHSLSLYLQLVWLFISDCILVFQILTLCQCFRHSKNEVSMKDFFSKCDQIHSFLRIWTYLLKKFLMENFIFCAVYFSKSKYNVSNSLIFLLIFRLVSIILLLVEMKICSTRTKVKVPMITPERVGCPLLPYNLQSFINFWDKLRAKLSFYFSRDFCQYWKSLKP